MDFSAALDNLKKGRKIRRKYVGTTILLDHGDIKDIDGFFIEEIDTTSILALDWEVVE
jgi:hypothetical protein